MCVFTASVVCDYHERLQNTNAAVDLDYILRSVWNLLNSGQVDQNIWLFLHWKSHSFSYLGWNLVNFASQFSENWRSLGMYMLTTLIVVQASCCCKYGK